jgi:hypothetical protein
LARALENIHKQLAVRRKGSIHPKADSISG